MSDPAKVVALHARPLQAAHLCFEVGGVLEELPAVLGAAVSAFDFANFYAVLRSRPTVTKDPSRLLYGFEEIQSFTKPFALATLRAEPTKAGLTQAINSRQNAYFAKYGHAADIVAQMNASYSPEAAGSKPNRLARLKSLAVNQAQALRGRYGFDQVTGVITETISQLHTDAHGQSEGSESSDDTGATDEKLHQDHTDSTLHHEGKSNNKDSSSSDQTITNKYRAYRTPLFESQALYERAQISLIDEQFSQFLYRQNLPALGQVLENELQSIDADVSRLQIAVLNTILMSPFPGVVTGIYKNSGECIRAGEPVVRVENDSIMLLVGTVVYRGRISIGSSVTIATSLFDPGPGAATQITGSVVAARGQDEDERWEVVFQCDNRDQVGDPILPFGYQFDYDDTTISIG
jgi:hypothetical protein